MKNTKQVKTSTLLIGLIFIGLIIFLIYRFSSSENSPKPPTLNSAVKGDVTQEETSTLLTTISSSPYLGSKETAKVAIVEYSDFECPYCKNFFEDTFNQIQKEYVDTGKIIFVYRNLPLSFHGEAAIYDANAALCAQNLKDNQTYFQMAHLIYQNSGLNGKGITTENMIKLATSIGLDETKFNECLSNNKFKDVVDQDTQDAKEAGVSGTPGFIVGTLNVNGNVTGELVSGAQPISVFKTTIDKYLK